MKNYFIKKVLLIGLSICLGFSLFAGKQVSKVNNSNFSVELTPQGECIYKIPDALDTENWVLFLNVVNKSSKMLYLEKIQFNTYSNSKLIASETNYYNQKIDPNSNYKLNLLFFRQKKNLNCDDMKVIVVTNLGKKLLDAKLKRYNQPVKVYFPLKGVWQVESAHGFGITHRRWDNRAQFAYDFSILDGNGNLYKGDPKNLNDYYAFGKPVFAPADCTVLKVHDGENDNPMGKVTKHANYVVLDLGNNVLCNMAHFKKGSIVVKKGQKLKRGDKIAEVGNSGMSDNPHLHMHIQYYKKDSNEPLKPGNPLPLSLSDIKVHPPYYKTWKYCKSGNPKSGDFIKSVE